MWKIVQVANVHKMQNNFQLMQPCLKQPASLSLIQCAAGKENTDSWQVLCATQNICKSQIQESSSISYLSLKGYIIMNSLLSKSRATYYSGDSTANNESILFTYPQTLTPVYLT